MLTSDEPRLTLHVELTGEDQHTVRMSVRGELDLPGAAQLEMALGGLPEGSPVELEMSRTEFIDSSGLRTLISCHNERPMTIVDPSEPVVRLCKLAEVTYLLTASDPAARSAAVESAAIESNDSVSAGE